MSLTYENLSKATSELREKYTNKKADQWFFLRAVADGKRVEVITRLEGVLSSLLSARDTGNNTQWNDRLKILLGAYFSVLDDISIEYAKEKAYWSNDPNNSILYNLLVTSLGGKEELASLETEKEAYKRAYDCFLKHAPEPDTPTIS